jgi:aldehyde dehydrogenase (NAD+)
VSKVLSHTTSGSVCVNDALFQYLNNNLPFGGVGNSGVGAYHGQASFTEFR